MTDFECGLAGKDSSNDDYDDVVVIDGCFQAILCVAFVFFLITR